MKLNYLIKSNTRLPKKISQNLSQIDVSHELSTSYHPPNNLIFYKQQNIIKGTKGRQRTPLGRPEPAEDPTQDNRKQQQTKQKTQLK